MMTLIDTSTANYQVAMVAIVETAKQTTNAAKLDTLCQLTLKALESRATSQPPHTVILFAV